MVLITDTNIKADIKVKLEAKARKQKLIAIWRRPEAKCLVVLIFKERIPKSPEVDTIPE